jgi:hypothetical protein
MLKKLMLTTAIGGLMVSGAMAQQSAPPADRTSPPAAERATPAPSSPSAIAPSDTMSGRAAVVTSQKPDQWLASKFTGTDVIGPNNEKIGDVSDVLLDKEGKVEAYVVGVGGFLGIGQKDVALAPSSFQPMQDNNEWKLKLSMTKEQLQQAAAFEPYTPPRATTGSGTPTRPAPAPASR